MECPGCKKDFPEEILSFMVGTSPSDGEVCGICALKRSNEVMGTNRESFNGEMAESFRLQAIAHLKKTGQE